MFLSLVARVLCYIVVPCYGCLAFFCGYLAGRSEGCLYHMSCSIVFSAEISNMAQRARPIGVSGEMVSMLLVHVMRVLC